MRLKDAVFKGKAEGPARKLRFSDGSWSPETKGQNLTPLQFKSTKLNAIAMEAGAQTKGQN
jgi:hypothetical protein